MKVAEKLRQFCLSLPETSEGSHFGSAAFKVGKKLFATCNGEQIVLGLEPDHADALVANDPRWTRYARDPNAVIIKTADVTDWNEIADLLRASYELAGKKATPKRATKQRSAKKRSAKKRTEA